MGLNITVHSYEDKLDFGLIAARELVPDLWDLVDLHIDEVERLFEATGAQWAVPQPPPAMRRGGHDGIKAIPAAASTQPAPATEPESTPAKRRSGKKRSGKKKAAT